MNLRPFEIGLIAFFGIAAIAGVIIVSVFQAKPSEDSLRYGDRVVIWGTLPQAPMDTFLNEVMNNIEALRVVSYMQIDERTFEQTLVNAIAEGRSPDMVIIPHSLIVSHRAKLTPISLETITPRMYRDSYIDGADIFMMSDGVYGIPFAVDPMVMYWNREMFSSSGLAQPPKTWEMLVAQTTPALTRLTDNRQVTQSAVAFGEYGNVAHAKDVLALLLLQAGSSLVTESAGTYAVTIGQELSSGDSVAETVLSFYTQFALPSKSLYTWNRSKATDLDEFAGGTLGMYFGPSSEWTLIEQKNPNLNYDVTSVPQGQGATTLRTYGDFYAFAIPRASQRAQGAFAVAQLFASPEYAGRIAELYNFAPVHRALFSTQGNDPVKNVRFQSALYARGWLDPSPQESDVALRQMVEEVTAGNTRYQQIILDTIYKLEELF